jgi:hypothetical protein
MIAILEQLKNCEQRSGLASPGLLHWYEALLQITPLCAHTEGCLSTLLYDEFSSPFMNIQPQQ